MQTTFAKLTTNHRSAPAVLGWRPEHVRPAPNGRALDTASSRHWPSAKPAEKPTTWNGDKNLIGALTSSTFYKDYERAFSEATGLVVALRPVESWQLPHHLQRHENPFCALVAQKSRSCAACLQVQQRLATTAVQEARTITCQAGLCDTAVPVRLGDRLIGFLQTGQVFLKRPTERQFEHTLKLAAEWGLSVDEPELRTAYFSGRVITARQHEAVIKLLTIFAQHLSMVSNQLLVQHQNAEPAVIAKAKEFILQHQGEDMTLGQVARAVNISTFYFCKLFKKVIGLNFTEYVSRIRIERAKNLLLNPNLRISEIAFEIGFQSLTHFNRVFGKMVGYCPTEYRAKSSLPQPAGARNMIHA
ncbi:MAG: helix-turn-helix domain-containing protein [Limisphaerales bacterium]